MVLRPGTEWGRRVFIARRIYPWNRKEPRPKKSSSKPPQVFTSRRARRGGIQTNRARNIGSVSPFNDVSKSSGTAGLQPDTAETSRDRNTVVRFFTLHRAEATKE
jgi:hypothetical protein